MGVTAQFGQRTEHCVQSWSKWRKRDLSQSECKLWEEMNDERRFVMLVSILPSTPHISIILFKALN